MIEMFEIIIFEYLLGFCFQGFVFIFGIYIFNRQKLIFKDYVIASILLAVITYLVRLLPITFGVHTIINLLVTFLLCILLLKMQPYNTIRSMAIVMVLSLIGEMIDLAVMSTIMGKESFEKAMQNTVQKAILGLPANIIFLLLIILSYYLLKKKGDSNRKISS